MIKVTAYHYETKLKKKHSFQNTSTNKIKYVININ